MIKKEDDPINEVKDEIDSAIKDPRGLVFHQKRLAFCLSLGITDLLERYIKNKNALKPGEKIDHRWLKKSKPNFKEILANKVTLPLAQLDKLDKIIDTAYKIELRRNELAYGKQASEKLLKDLINIFLETKKEVENDWYNSIC